MRYTVLFCSKRGVKRVNPGQARSGSHARRPTPRRFSVFCSTILDIRISNSTQKHMVRWGWSVIRIRRRRDIAVCWADAVHPTFLVPDFGGQRGRYRSDPRGGKVMREFVGKAAFVTGGASGIGLALGRAFAEAGCKVMLADIEKAALDAGVASLSGSGLEIGGVVCDVADPASVDAAAQATFSAFGKVHILCNNAGVGALGGIEHIALDDWRWVLDVNMIGVVNGVRAFLPHMRAHGEGGHIVNTASMAGMFNSGQRFAPYPASKYAVVGISEGLAKEVKSLGIGVSILCPGVVRTNVLESARNRPQR